VILNDWAARSRTRLAHDEHGLGLIELLVSMVLLGVICLVVSGFYISTIRTVSHTGSLAGNTREASNGMNEASRVLRAATENPVVSQQLSDPAFVSASTESVTIYAYVNLGSSTQAPIKIRLEVDANRQLVETQWAASGSTNGYFTFTNPTPTSTRILAGTVAAQAGTAPYLFTYLLANGVELPVPAGGFTVAQLRTIAAVTVTLTVQGSTTDARSAVTLQNTVGLPNLPLFRTGP